MVEIDFLPERVKDLRARQRRMIRRAWLLVGTIGILAVLGTIRQGWVRQARAEAFQLAEGRVNREAMRQQKVRLEARLAGLLVHKRIGDRLGISTKPMDVLAGIEAVARGADKNHCMVFRELTIQSGSPVPAAPAGERGPVGRGGPSGGPSPAATAVPAKGQVVIVAIAADDVTVANFIAQLSANRMFEDVNMEYTKTIPFGGLPEAREFKVTCRVAR